MALSIIILGMSRTANSIQPGQTGSILVAKTNHFRLKGLKDETGRLVKNNNSVHSCPFKSVKIVWTYIEVIYEMSRFDNHNKLLMSYFSGHVFSMLFSAGEVSYLSRVLTHNISIF